MRRKDQLLLFCKLAVVISIMLLPSSICAAGNTDKTETGIPFIANGIPVDQGEIALLTRYEVKRGYGKKFRKALRGYTKAAISNDGNLMAEACYEEDKPQIFWLIERWKSKAAMEKARHGKKYKWLQILSGKKLTQAARSISVKDLEPLSKEEWRRAPGETDQPVIIILFVDSRQGTENQFKEVYHKAMPEFRSEPGVINYQLSQLEEDDTQFVTYEKFRNEAAFQYHLNFPPIKPVIDYLNTSIKKQPFQAGLHRLIVFAPKKQK